MLKGLAIFIVILAAANAPAHAKQEHSTTNGSAQSPAADKRGTKESPLVVDAHAIYSDKEAAEEAAKVEEQKSTNRWNVDLTGVIAACAFLQFLGIVAQVCVYRHQSRLMTLALRVNYKALAAAAKASKATEDQVKLAQQTIVHTQRPKIIVRTFYFSESSGTLPHNDGLAAGSFARGQFYLVNIGGTNATVEEIWCEPYIGRILPGKHPYEGKIGHQQSVALRPGESTPYLFGLNNPLEALTASLLKGPSESFYVLGWIGYRDDLGIYRKTRFCRQYISGRDRFVPVVDDPDYESAE